MSKAVSEQRAWSIAQELGLQLTCVRPSAIYGAYDPNAMRLFRRLWNRFISISPIGTVFPLVYAGDVAHAVVHALERDHTIGQSYNTAGGPEPLRNFYHGWKAAHFATPQFALPVPIPLRFFYDNSRAAKDLDFKNRPYAQGLSDAARIEAQNLL